MTQIVYDKAVDTYPSTIKYVSHQCKSHKMCGKAVLFPINIRLNKYVISSFLKILLSKNIIMIDIRLKKCVIKPLMIFFEH